MRRPGGTTAMPGASAISRSARRRTTGPRPWRRKQNYRPIRSATSFRADHFARTNTTPAGHEPPLAYCYICRAAARRPARTRANRRRLPIEPRALDLKRADATAASAAGLTRDQIVGVYAFETGGNGTYDMQDGVTPTRPNAISPAVGYNQLLSTNTVSILAEHGNQLMTVLRQKS